MPGWQPNWHDVRFDHAAAAEAVRACEQAVRLLDGVGDAHEREAGEAAADWTGSAASRFADQRAVVSTVLQGAIDALLDAIRRIEDAADQATELQRHRERERERWYDERRAEQLAAMP